jgi:hypothetical protein
MNNFTKLYPKWTSFCLAIFLALAGMAQVTTSSVEGSVKDSVGKPVPNATVQLVHQPTGVTYTAITSEKGRFNITNLRVGGPYAITISSVGFAPYTEQGFSLVVGQAYDIDALLREDGKSLQNVVVRGSTDNIFKSSRTGLATTIGADQLRNLPTISRSAADYTRLTPSADGLSFAGRNSQYNNFSLDGAVFNNPFGLDAATPGGQSDAQPISLDAIEQIQVNIAPFDVTQAGFTGAAINTVTKSGTNALKGTVFGFYRNQDLTGSKVKGEKIVVPDLNQSQFGFSLGGPIVKNKLFFFINAELERRTDLGSNFVANRGTGAKNESRVAATDLEAVSNVLRQRFQYETGAYEGYTHKTQNQKGIAKLDWIINSKHSVSASFNFLDASKEKPAHPAAINRRGPDLITLQFRNSGYRINNKLYNINFEVKSNFNSKLSNKLRVINTAFRDTRDPFSVPFPVINIHKNGVPYIIAGHEPFSVNNVLNQDAFQITDNLTYLLGKHTFTAGMSFERFKFDNSFNLFGYGSPFETFVSTQAFVDSVNKGALDGAVAGAKAAAAAQKWNVAKSTVGQYAAYLQDEFNATDRLKLTVGLRMDVPLYFNTADNIAPMTENITYYNGDGQPVRLDNTKLPKQTPLFSPRFGFNWNALGNKTLQIRGGSGLFTGRLPFVWIGNQVANPNWFYFNVTAPTFKWPQVWRNNIGADYRLKNNWVATIDVVYTKDVNAMMVRNYGLAAPTGRLNGVDQRPVYQFSNYAIYSPAAGVNIPATSTYVFDNVKVGSSFNLGLQLQKTFGNGFYAMMGYNFLDATDASSISAEISGDAYDRNPAFGNVNNAVATPSLYGNRHRFVGAAFKKFDYSKGKMATTVSLFAQYAKGGRFTYTYSGDLNGDNSGLNDLLLIPTDQQLQQMQFSGSAAQQVAQRDAFRNYILQDDYLRENRGNYAEKYGILSPWYGTWDLRVLQDFNLKAGKKTNTIQVSLDVLNIGNLISSNWGVRQFPVNTQPVGVSVSNNTPVYSFDTALKNTFANDFSLLSRWQIQFGVRYIF